MVRRIAVRGIVINTSGQLFAIRLKPYNEMKSIKETWWCLPGGGLDAGESLQKGLEREILEELGVGAKVGSLLYVHQFAFNGIEHLEFFFHIANHEGFGNIDLAKTTHGAHEIAELGFVNPKSTNLKPIFLGQENIVKQIVQNQPPKIFDYLDS